MPSGHEGGRGEDEFQLVDLLQLLAQRLEGEDREGRGGDLELRAGVISALRSSPSRSLMLSMIFTEHGIVTACDRNVAETGCRLAALTRLPSQLGRQ